MFLLCITITLLSTSFYGSEKSKDPSLTKKKTNQDLMLSRKCAPGESPEYGAINHSSQKSQEGYTNSYEDFDNDKKIKNHSAGTSK